MVINIENWRKGIWFSLLFLQSSQKMNFMQVLFEYKELNTGKHSWENSWLLSEGRIFQNRIANTLVQS